MIVIISKEHNVMVNSEELIGTTEYATIYTRRRINQCRYNRIRFCVCVCVCVKVKSAIEQATRAKRGSRGIALLFFQPRH